MDRRSVALSAVVGLTVLVGLLAYVDLKVELAELRGRMDAAPPTPTAPATDQLPALPGSSPGATPRAVSPQDLAADDPEAVPGDPWACTGHIGSEMVRTAVGQHGRDVFTCHGLHPAGGGGSRQIRLELRVAADGKVTMARLQGDEQPGFVACLRDKVRDWRFAPPIGGNCAVVSAPFRLDPAEPSEGDSPPG